MTIRTDRVRPFSADDYQGLTEVFNSVETGHPEGPELLRHADETKDPALKNGRLVIERDGRLVAAGEYYQNPGMYHPRKFNFRIAVRPELQGQGLGRKLYFALTEDLARHRPVTLRGMVVETSERSLRFAKSRGFAEEKRDWESRLDVASFDPSPYAGLIEGLAAEGISIKSLAELGDDPAMPRKYHEVFSVARLDVPRTEPATPVAFEKYYEWVFKAPDFRPESHFVALDGETYVGMTQLWLGDDSPDAFTGLTAVRREYRGRKIALALKLRSISLARQRGIPAIHTDNDSMNAPMLAINDKLGFVRKPALITFRKDLSDSV